MKKAASLLLSLIIVLCFAGVSAAEEPDLTNYAIANGTVAAATFEDVVAPCSGTLRPFDWNIGDRVEAGEVLFELMTTRITAPEDGKVRSLFVEQGDSADDAMATYGKVLALEPAVRQRIRCTYTNATDNQLCRHRHVGDTLYFKAGREKGVGKVILADGSNYLVEIEKGTFDVDKKLDMYLDKVYSYNKKSGTGTVFTRDDLAIAAAGRVAEVLVSVGDTVKKGDTLMTVLSSDADRDASPRIAAAKEGVLSLVAVASGQQVWKGALLARIWHTDELEIVAEVDEMDLGGLKVGDSLPVTMDTDESNVLTGVVTEISGLGVTRQNAAYYTVHLSVAGDGLLLGQSASVYLPKE